jgi:hypothetical protein
MTPGNIEAAFGTALVSVVNNANWPIFPATRDGDVPDDSCVMVRCDQARHVAGGYYQADVDVSVVSSSLIEGEVATARGIATAIHTYLRGNPAPAGSGFTVAGIHVASVSSTEADRRWMQSVQFVCGVAPA